MPGALMTLAMLAGAAMAHIDLEGPSPDDIRAMMDAETSAYGTYMPEMHQYGAMGYGAKVMSGGAGEGHQALKPEAGFKWRQEVKTDRSLPAYCNPPNPCPKGHDPERDNCMSMLEFRNTAEFSESYQEAQNCICDQEHMSSCPSQRDSAPARSAEPAMDEDDDELQGDINAALERYLAAQAGLADESSDDSEVPEMIARSKKNGHVDMNKYADFVL